MKFLINVYKVKAETKEVVDFIVSLLNLRQFETIKSLSFRSNSYLVSPIDFAAKVSVPSSVVVSELASVNYAICKEGEAGKFEVFVSIPEVGFGISPESVKNMIAVEVANFEKIFASFDSKAAALFLHKLASKSVSSKKVSIKELFHEKNCPVRDLPPVASGRSDVDFSDDAVFVNYRSILSANADTLLKIKANYLVATKLELFNTLSYFMVRDSFLVETWYLATDSQIKALLS